MTLPDGNGVYLIVNKATGTAVDLGGGQITNGTKLTGWTAYRESVHSFNQMWLIEQVQGETFYTVRNIRSNTFMDLHYGSAQNGTVVYGWEYNGTAAQQWYIEGNDQTGYVFKNRAAGTVLDLSGANQANGTPITCYGSHGGANQRWYLHCHSRSAQHIDSLLRDSPLIGMDFKHYKSDGLYVTLPPDVVRLIWDNKGLGSRKWRDESYDCDDFTFAMKGAVSDWVYDNIRAPVGVVFGIMYGSGSTSGHAYNWYPNMAFSSIVVFEPQNGDAQTKSEYKAFFGIY